MTPDDYDKLRGSGHDPFAVVDKKDVDASREHARQLDAVLHPLIDRFDWLNGRGFTAKQLCAGVNISEDSLTNWLRKQKLEIYSPATVQGRARNFCLADAYLIALVAALATLTSQTKHSIIIARRWLCLEPLIARIGYAPKPEQMANAKHQKAIANFYDAARADAQIIGRAAGWRDHDKPFYLVLTPHSSEWGQFVSFCEQDPDRNWFTREPAAVFVNLTLLFSTVDLRLMAACQGERA